MSRKRKSAELTEIEEVAAEVPPKKVSKSLNFCVVFIMLHSGLSCRSVDELQFFSLPYNEEYIKGNFVSPGCKSIIHYTADIDDTKQIADIIKDNLLLSRSGMSGKSIMENIMTDIKSEYIKNHAHKYEGKDNECALEFKKMKESGFKLQYTSKCSWLSSFVSDSCKVAIKEYELNLEYGKLPDGRMGYGERTSTYENPRVQLFESTNIFDDNITLFFHDGRIVHLLRDNHNLAFVNYVNRKTWGKATYVQITFTTQHLFDFLRDEYPGIQFAFVDGGCSNIMTLSKDAQLKADEFHRKTPFNYGGLHKKSKRKTKRRSNRRPRNRRPKTQKYSK